MNFETVLNAYTKTVAATRSIWGPDPRRVRQAAACRARLLSLYQNTHILVDAGEIDLAHQVEALKHTIALLEEDAAYKDRELRSALVAAGHTDPNCPVVAGASVDCWCPQVGTLWITTDERPGSSAR